MSWGAAGPLFRGADCRGPLLLRRAIRPVRTRLHGRKTRTPDLRDRNAPETRGGGGQGRWGRWGGGVEHRDGKVSHRSAEAFEVS